MEDSGDSSLIALHVKHALELIYAAGGLISVQDLKPIAFT